MMRYSFITRMKNGLYQDSLPAGGPKKAAKAGLDQPKGLIHARTLTFMDDKSTFSKKGLQPSQIQPGLFGL